MGQSSDKTVSIAMVRGLAQGLGRLGLAVEPLLDEAGIDPSLLEDPDARVPLEAVIELWKIGPGYADDDCFGLHAAEFLIGEQVALGRLDVVDYLSRSSATLGDALHTLTQFNRLFHAELLDLRIDSTRRTTQLTCELLDVARGTLRHAAECCVAAIVLAIRQALGEHWSPHSIRFQHSRPRQIGEHKRIFRAPLAFASPVHAICIETRELRRPLATADSRLTGLLQPHATGLISSLPGAPPFVDRVRAALVDATWRGDVSADSTARRLGVSRRTLQDRLREGGTSFRKLLDEVRRNQAIALVKKGDTALTEIAFLLGFSGRAAFHRAFRRWTGKGPVEYRNRRGRRPRGAG